MALFLRDCSPQKLNRERPWVYTGRGEKWCADHVFSGVQEETSSAMMKEMKVSDNVPANGYMEAEQRRMHNPFSFVVRLF